MAYVEGFVVPVPAANKEAYRQLAARCAPLFREFGATRLVEAWGDDVPEGEVTDFSRAVKAEAGEVIVFSWLEFPGRATRDAANAKMRSDPRMKDFSDMPFDGRRMIFGGFTPVIDEAAGGRQAGQEAGYVDGSLLPVPAAAREAYCLLAASQAAVFREHGAIRVVEAWGDDLPDGKLTDFKGAVQASGDEAVVYSWVEWPSKDVRDAGWPKVFADPRMRPEERLFDCQRRVFGGFAMILDE